MVGGAQNATLIAHEPIEREVRLGVSPRAAWEVSELVKEIMDEPPRGRLGVARRTDPNTEEFSEIWTRPVAGVTRENGQVVILQVPEQNAVVHEGVTTDEPGTKVGREIFVQHIRPSSGNLPVADWRCACRSHGSGFGRASGGAGGFTSRIDPSR